MTNEVLFPRCRRISISANTATQVEFAAVKQFSLQVSTAVDLKIAATEAAVNGTDAYFSLKAEKVMNGPEKLSFTGALWLKAASNVTVEIVEWVAVDTSL